MTRKKMPGRGRGRSNPNNNNPANLPGYPSPPQQQQQHFQQRQQQQPQQNGAGPSTNSASAASSASDFERLSLKEEANQRQRHDSGVGRECSSSPETETPSLTTAPKTSPGTVGQRVLIDTQSYLIEFDHDQPMYRYDVRIEEDMHNGKEITRGAANDHALHQRRTLAYYIFATLTNKVEPVFFGDFWGFVYDRRHILFAVTPLNIQDDETKEFRVSMERILECWREAYPDLTEAAMRQKFDIRSEVSSFIVRIKPATGSADDPFEMRPKDFTGLLNPDLAVFDRSNLQFMELLTSQTIYYNDQRVTFGNNTFESGGNRLTDNVEWRRGLKKNVRLVDNNGRKGYVMQLDQKIGAFLIVRSAVDVLATELGVSTQQIYTPSFNCSSHPKFNRANKFINGFAFQQRMPNKPSRSFDCIGVSESSAEYQTFYCDEYGWKISVYQYFLKKHGFTLRYPHLPCLRALAPKRRGSNKESDGFMYFPLELCWSLDNQRLDMQKQEPYAAQIIKISAMTPNKRTEQIETEAYNTNLHTNPQLDACGARIAATPMQVQARVLPRPTAVYGEREQTTIDEHGGWRPKRGTKYLRGARLDKWAVLVLWNDRGQPCVNWTNLSQFLEKFKRAAMTNGMKNVKHPEVIQAIADEPKVITQNLRAIANQLFGKGPAVFVLVITTDRSDSHDHLKLCEIELDQQVLTQHMVTRSMNRVIGIGTRPEGKPDVTILENLLMKANMKLGGINFDLLNTDRQLFNIDNPTEWASHKRLFMGLDVCHPPPLKNSMKRKNFQETQPSVVGICANAGDHPLAFVGDYTYQAPRLEVAVSADNDVLRSECRRLITMYMRNNKDYPKEIWMYRDGVSEGQYGQVVISEVEQIRAAIRDTKPPKCQEPALLYIVVTKRHNTRLYLQRQQLQQMAAASRRNHEQNIKSGTIDDRFLVHPAYKEFYLHSHKVIQGTAKTPRYTVLVDDVGYDMDTLQVAQFESDTTLTFLRNFCDMLITSSILALLNVAITHKLCFAHGIITSAVSIPAPCYAAHNLAKRGKANMRAFVGGSGDSSSSGFASQSGASQSEATDKDEQSRLKAYGKYTVDDLNQKLKYAGGALSNQAYHA